MRQLASVDLSAMNLKRLSLLSKACIWLREYLFTALLISGHKLKGSCKDLVMILCTQLKPTCERMLVPRQCLQAHLAAS